MQSLKNKKKHSLIIFLLVATVLSSGMAAAVLFGAKIGPFAENIKNTSSPSSDSPAPMSDKDLGVKPATDRDPTSSSVKTNPQPTKNSGEISLEITTAQSNGDSLIVRTLLSKLTTEGVCSLSINDKSGNSIFTASAGVQALVSSSTCKGFEVPLTKLSRGSTYTIVITYSLDTTSVDAKKEVTVDA